MKKELTFLSEGFSEVFITAEGKVLSNRTGKTKELNQYQDAKGYCYIKLWNRCHKKAQHLAIHRLVGQAFVSNPSNDPEIDHLDRNKSNNLVSNLEWVTRKENVRRSNNPLTNNTPVMLMNGDEEVGMFDSKAQASRYAHTNFGVGYHAMYKYGKSGDLIMKV